jgi:hypothetical protein
MSRGGFRSRLGASSGGFWHCTRSIKKARQAGEKRIIRDGEIGRQGAEQSGRIQGGSDQGSAVGDEES